jgi:hypothetical protein
MTQDSTQHGTNGFKYLKTLCAFQVSAQSFDCINYPTGNTFVHLSNCYNDEIPFSHTRVTTKYATKETLCVCQPEPKEEQVERKSKSQAAATF